MCEPVTISTGAMWAIGALTAASTYVAYDSSKKAGEANAQVAENNAKLAADDARTAQAIGDRESQQQTWRTRQIEGQQRAAIAASGLDSQFGTPSELLGETSLFGEVDQQAIRLNTARQAWGFNAQAQNARNQSSVDRYSGRQQRVGTVLGGMTSFARTAYGV